MSDGFLGFDTTFMLDFVVCALVLIVPLLAYSVYLVRVRRQYLLHRNLQAALGALLLVAVTAFEVDVQVLHGGWENVVNKPGRPVRLSSERVEEVRHVLQTHLVFAMSTPLLWGITLLLAWRRFPRPPAPAPHSRLHKTLGWASTADLVATSATGLWFYYVAFVR